MKKFYVLLVGCLFLAGISMQAQKVSTVSVVRETDEDAVYVSELEETEYTTEEQASLQNRAPQADYPMYTGVRYLRARQNGSNFNFDLFLTINQANGTPVSGLHVIDVNTGSNTKIEGTHTITYTTAQNCSDKTWIVDKDKDYADDPKGQITLTYKRMGNDGYPIYRLQANNIRACQSGSYYYFGGFDKEVTVKAYNYDLDQEITLTDYFDGISITTSTTDRYIDNTGADADWKYWLLAGAGTGSDNKSYRFTLKYNSATTLGSFASSLSDTEVTSLYQGSTKIEYTSVETTVTEYKTGKYKVVATFTATSGKQYMVTADFTDDCVATDEVEPQGDVPCTAYFALDQMSMTSQKTLGSKMCDADWKTGNGWSKTFTVLQATNSEGANVKLFFSDITTQSYNAITAPAADDYIFAKAELANDKSYAGYTECFNSTGWENLYYFGFVYDLSGTTYTLYSDGFSDYSNVAVGQGESNPYIGSQAYFPGAYSDPENDYVYASYHKICPYWSYYVCPNSNEKIYFDSNDVIHVERKADGNVFIQVRDKNDASAVYVQIGTAASEQGGTENGEGTSSTPTIKLSTYVNGRGSVAVSPDECLYAAGETITLTPTPDNSDWTFSGWTGDCAIQITANGDGTYTYTVPANDCAVIANFTEGASYDVTFINYDLQVLQQGKVKKDDVPVYTGKTPEHTQDERFTYTFSGWSNGNNFYGKDEALPAVTQEITYTAQYIQEDRLYTVIFNNYDNEELWRGGFAYNVAASYGGETPMKPEDEDYAYVFSGWTDGTNTYGVNDILPAVTTDGVVYTAVFEQEPLELHIVLIEDEDADYYNRFSDKYNGRRATTVTLNRQFTQGKWATLCLPFNVNTALVTSLGMMNRVYEFKYTKGSEAEGITLYFSQAKKLEAGKGYIVNANAALAKRTSFVFPDVEVNTGADINSGFDIANLEGYNSQGTVYLVGTLRTGLLLGSETGTRYMGLKDNKIFYPNPEQGTNVRAYRGIFRNTEDMQVSRVRIVVEGEDGEQVSELEVINGSLEDSAAPKKFLRNGILYIERNGELFTAEGQRVE